MVHKRVFKTLGLLLFLLSTCFPGILLAEDSPRAGTRKVLTLEGVKFAFRWCPPGEFLMGSKMKYSKEYGEFFVTPHRVQLTKGFWILETEVTQKQYKKLMGETPTRWWIDDSKPVQNASWNSATDFCRRLNRKNKEFHFRLPTESEWEYACRAKNGDCRYGKIRDIAWVFENTDEGNGSTGPRAVGTKKPNKWGVHDMLGNVSEWCSDWMGSPPTGETADPSGPAKGSMKVVRGGNCMADQGERATDGQCLAGTRHAVDPQSKSRLIGFRIVAREIRD